VGTGWELGGNGVGMKRKGVETGREGLGTEREGSCKWKVDTVN